jgi:glycosyltransferase involved in cell wall biosynthesis
VVISENCGVAPLLADIAGIAVPHQTEALARAVERILSDGELRTQLSRGGRNVAKRLGWEEPVVAMENLYGRLAARPIIVGQSAGPNRQ